MLIEPVAHEQGGYMGTHHEEFRDDSYKILQSSTLILGLHEQLSF